MKNNLTNIIACAFCSLSLQAAFAGSDQGVSLGAGIGAMIAVDAECYYDVKADGYPQASLCYDAGSLLWSASVGLVYRQETIGADSATILLMPVCATVRWQPLKLFPSWDGAQPYCGLGLGGYFGVGDNENSFAMVAPTLGLTMGRTHVVDLGYSYHKVYENSPGDQLDYHAIVAAYRYRFGL